MGCGERGKEVYLHTIPQSLSEYKAHKRQLQENAKSGDWVGCDILSNWSILFNIGQPYSYVFFWNVLLKFFFRTAFKQFLEQTRKKFKIGSLSPEEKLPNEQFSIEFKIFSNNT